MNIKILLYIQLLIFILLLLQIRSTKYLIILLNLLTIYYIYTSIFLQFDNFNLNGCCNIKKNYINLQTFLC